MTPEIVKSMVADIAREAREERDDEAAHSMQDDLYLSLLKSIADGSCENPKICAAEAIKVADIQFCRWCA